MEALTETAWRRCRVHFSRDARDYPPRKADDDGLMKLRRLYDRHDVAEAR